MSSADNFAGQTREFEGAASALVAHQGGVDAAVKSLAIEYARRGIRVNAVSPGLIKTPMHAPQTYDATGAQHPMIIWEKLPISLGAILYLGAAPL